MKRNGLAYVKGMLLVLALGLLVVCVVFLTGNPDKLNIMPLERTLVWESPSYAVRGGDGLLVVDSSKTRITVLDAEGRIAHVIHGSGGDDSFANTDYIASDGKYIYVADVVYASSGTRVSEEHIRKFTMEGDYVSSVFSIQYPDGKESMPAQNGYICWMGSYEGEIYFLYYDKNTLTVNQLNRDRYNIVRTFDGKLPEIWNITYDAGNDRMYLVGKDSRVYAENDAKNGFTAVDTIRYDDRSIFSDIDACGGSVYATDLGMAQTVRVTDGTVVMGGDNPAENTLIYRVSASQDGAVVTDNMLVYTVSADGEITYAADSAVYADALYRDVLLTWLSLAVIILAAAAFLCAMLVSTLKNNRSKYTATSLIVAAAVIASTAAISTTILTDTFARLTETSRSALVRTADVISASSPVNGIGDAVREINDIADYGSEAHLFLQNYMDAYCDAAYNSGSNMYYVVYKFNEDLVYGIADYEKTAGAIYPYCPYADSDYQYVAETGEIISVAASMDAYGAWSFAIAPLYDSDGNISAVAEFGINMQTEQMQNYDLITSIIVRVAVIIVLILLLLIEGTVLFDGIAKFRTERSADIPYFLRPMIFLTFFASNLSAAFIPQMSMVLYEGAELGLSETVASALPMSAQLFATAAAALLAGRLLEKCSMKVLMLIACGVQMAGYGSITAAALTEDYLLFCGGHLLSGLGIGVIVVALNTLPDRIADEGLRNSYYAGLNAGIISGVVIGTSVGSYISEMFGHAAVFAAGGIVVLFVTLLVLLSVGHGRRSAVSDEAPEARISTARFLTSRDVLSFVLCVMVPMLILLYFKDYLFPLYGYDNGMDDVSIGNILLFAGAASIMFGTTLSDWLLRHAGTTGTVILSSALTCGTLVMFGLVPSRETAIAAVIILSLATGFGLAGQEVFYTSLPIFRSYGPQRAMSVYSIFDNISQTAAPLLMGAMLVFGYAAECLYLGTAGLALLVIFIFIRLISKVQGRKKQNHD